jgi:F-type H+-transporting ATPase subunit a
MASPILHIKDAYYFEVPKKLWQHHYSSLEEVPGFLREGHPEIKDPRAFEEALHGKILLYPQPFGELKNLYEPASGFCISKFMILTAVAAVAILLIFVKLAKRVKTGDRPRGKFWNLFESMLLFVRDEVARPAIGKHDADKYVPLLWTLFFFVLFCNLLGMVPWAGAPTSAFAVTLSLAAVTLLTGMASGIIKFGPVGYIANQIPHMDLPPILAIVLKPMIWVIEVAGMLIKHGVLGVRLLANMVAGHVVLLGIMALAFSVEGATSGYWGITAPIAIVSSTLFSILELFVAFLQAYVFTFLSALFIGAAVHHH